ncbi:hypothetical protein P43SY_006003 [Pythium insidiosum]|uniref:Uncharacterized protein n=1 Tax=Pythium insidiosum TaxID=114742 RepID=A0AAD5LI07_PYTIN|nr:hypothetical protein P43SY_006003 [Pythium insidiosum]
MASHQSQDAAFAQRISADEYERQAVEYTTAMVEQLNAAVREDPSIASQSSFFQDPLNVKRGLPVFQGKHTRFVYDDEEEEIVAAVDATEHPAPGPRVRTVADLPDMSDEEEEDEEEDEEEYEEDEEEYDEEEGAEDDLGVENAFYSLAADGEVDPQLQQLLQDVTMLSTVDVSMED